MIPVSEALDGIFALLTPLEPEPVPLTEAAGRVLARPARATRAQPPFRAAIMDGYALRDAAPGACYRIIGEAAAGRAFAGAVGAGEAVRIFTGAPVPEGADRVVIQEDVEPSGPVIRLGAALDPGPYVRPAGADFAAGSEIPAPRRLTPADIALLAAMNVPEVWATRRPEVAIIATGDELVMPGEAPAPEQIVASNGLGLAAMLRAAGALPRLLPIAADTESALNSAFDLARGADLVVTIGGASVGDHDLVKPVAAQRGLERAFYKVAMRPGKPLMAGRVDGAPMVGLPGNPVSSMVCGQVFLVPAVRCLLGLGAAPAPRRQAPLARSLPANGPREHYMRGTLGPDGLTAAPRQDSALLSVLAGSDVLIVRPPHDAPRKNGELLDYLLL